MRSSEPAQDLKIQGTAANLLKKGLYLGVSGEPKAA